MPSIHPPSCRAVERAECTLRAARQRVLIGSPGASTRYRGAMATEQPDLPDSISANVAEWTQTNKEFTDAQAIGAWEPQELEWGVFGVREDAIGSPLGDINGLDVTRRLRDTARTRDVPVIALTGRALDTDEKACLEAGCTAYLAKPIDSAALLRRIGELAG